MSHGMSSYSAIWERNCDLLAKALQSLDRKTATIRRSTNKVVFINDINKEREKVKQATSTANNSDVQGIQHQLQQVERLMKLDSNLNMEGVKLMNEAQVTLNAYQSACDNFYKKCITVEKNSRDKRNSKAFSASHDGNYCEEEYSVAPFLKDGLPNVTKVAFEDDLYREIIAEKAKETQEIADSVKDIHEIFVHINEMVQVQGGQLETVSVNVSSAERSIFNANENLRLAYQHHRSSCTLKFLLIFVAVMFVIVIIALLLS